MQVANSVYLTADYPFLANPAYNLVRGLVHMLAGRLLARF
jgi:hypothetical protein